MAFTLGEFSGIRPFVYHLTSRKNLEQLIASRVLYSASRLFRKSGNHQWLAAKRRETVTIKHNGVLIDIRDQQSLYEGKMALEGGWTFGEVIRSLNERVFFWPGKGDGPIDYGRRHYKRYQNDDPAIVRVRTEDLLGANPSASPHLGEYNSGSPRTVNGCGSPRGPSTFIDCVAAAFTALSRLDFSETMAAAGQLRTTLINQLCVAGYLLGVPPRLLSGLYSRARVGESQSARIRRTQ